MEYPRTTKFKPLPAIIKTGYYTAYSFTLNDKGMFCCIQSTHTETFNSTRLDLPNSLLSADVERSFLIGRSMREKLELSATASAFLLLPPFSVVRVRAEANKFVRFGESWAPESTSSVGVRGSSSSLSEQPAGSSARPSEKGPWTGAI